MHPSLSHSLALALSLSIFLASFQACNKLCSAWLLSANNRKMVCSFFFLFPICPSVICLSLGQLVSHHADDQQKCTNIFTLSCFLLFFHFFIVYLSSLFFFGVFSCAWSIHSILWSVWREKKRRVCLCWWLL